MKELPKIYDPKQVESKIYRAAASQGLAPTALSLRSAGSLLLPFCAFYQINIPLFVLFVKPYSMRLVVRQRIHLAVKVRFCKLCKCFLEIFVEIMLFILLECIVQVFVTAFRANIA